MFDDLPLVPSERRQLKDKIKEQKKRADEIYGCLMRKVNGIIIRADYLTTEQKSKLIEELLK